MEKKVERGRMLILLTGIYSSAIPPVPDDPDRGVKSSILNRISSLFGFTILELIIVIFIVSLFVAISIPSFTGIESNEIRSEAKRIASILRYLNDSAMAKKEELYLIVNLQDNSVTYSTEDGEKRERLEYLRALYLETKGEINSGEVKIIFTPLGAGEFIRFHMTTEPSVTLQTGKPAFIVELNPMNGRVKISEGVSR